MKYALMLVLIAVANMAVAQQGRFAEAIEVGSTCLARGEPTMNCITALHAACAAGIMGEVQGAGRGFCDGAVGRTAGYILSRAQLTYRNACVSDETEYELFVAASRAWDLFTESECALERYRNRQSSGSGESIRSACRANFSFVRTNELIAQSERCAR